MNEQFNNRIDIDRPLNIPIGWWVGFFSPYLRALLWLLFVILFAYLSIAVDFFITKEHPLFWDVYSKMQNNYVACFANFGFFFFAGVDYWQTHHHYQNYELQGWIIIISIISAAITILLPLAIILIEEQNGVLCVRGKEYSIIWLSYVMHIYYLISLFLLRGETQRVRSIEKYKTSYKENQYIKQN